MYERAGKASSRQGSLSTCDRRQLADDVREPETKEVIVKRIIPVLAISAAFASLPASASASASKEVVFDDTSGICQSGLTSGTPTDSFAVINTHAGNVSVEVSLKGLEPDTTYQVDLVQTPSGESCLQQPGETSLTTNGRGNGNAHWSEPILPGQTGVFAQLFGAGLGDVLATPTVPLS
jgi:hypothetical protein